MISFLGFESSRTIFGKFRVRVGGLGLCYRGYWLGVRVRFSDGRIWDLLFDNSLIVFVVIWYKEI